MFCRGGVNQADMDATEKWKGRLDDVAKKSPEWYFTSCVQIVMAEKGQNEGALLEG